MSPFARESVYKIGRVTVLLAVGLVSARAQAQDAPGAPPPATVGTPETVPAVPVTPSTTDPAVRCGAPERASERSIDTSIQTGTVVTAMNIQSHATHETFAFSPPRGEKVAKPDEGPPTPRNPASAVGKGGPVFSSPRRRAADKNSGPTRLCRPLKRARRGIGNRLPHGWKPWATVLCSGFAGVRFAVSRDERLATIRRRARINLARVGCR